MWSEDGRRADGARSCEELLPCLLMEAGTIPHYGRLNMDGHLTWLLSLVCLYGPLVNGKKRVGLFLFCSPQGLLKVKIPEQINGKGFKSMNK